MLDARIGIGKTKYVYVVLKDGYLIPMAYALRFQMIAAIIIQKDNVFNVI